jgi:site-specific DNA-methyltransferase (cytosine-N4-specific)
VKRGAARRRKSRSGEGARAAAAAATATATATTPVASRQSPAIFHRTGLGAIRLGDALEVLAADVPPGSADLIVTSPPFGLVRKKAYGNVAADEYLEWFRPFGAAFLRALKPEGSLVIDIGGSWIPGQPTRSLYHFELLILLCRELGFHLAQEFFWWNPAKLPSPAEWVTVRRIRVKDAVNCIWWLSPTPWPRASNRRVLAPYSDSMRDLLRNGYRAKLRPSGHDISTRFASDNGAAIPPNLIAVANTESNSHYLRYCAQRGLTPHPARFPAEIPEFFIRMLTDPGDLVIDPFAGSCVAGEVAERLGRRWIAIDTVEEYLAGAVGRFAKPARHRQLELFPDAGRKKTAPPLHYKAYHPGAAWGRANGQGGEALPADGGRERGGRRKAKPAAP